MEFGEGSSLHLSYQRESDTKKFFLKELIFIGRDGINRISRWMVLRFEHPASK